EQNQRLPAFLTTVGWLCSDCILASLKKQAERENPDDWPSPEIKNALRPNAPIRWKLFILWRIDKALARVSKTGPQDAAAFLTDLVELLGQNRVHPLDRPIRFTALTACYQLGATILPELLRRSQSSRQKSWILHVNLLNAATTIDPANSQVQN